MKIRSALPILPLLVAGYAGLSCADIASPSRSQFYEWRRITATGPGTSDTMSFHWPRSRLPVKIWTEDTFGLPSHVQHGIDEWRRAFLYGEFDAVRVSDSSVADVIVRAGNFAKNTLAVLRLEGSMAPECTGSTNFDLPPGSRELQVPIRVFVNPRFEPSVPGVAECLALTTTHELGHAIGILEHSPVATDIMYVDPVVSALSNRDRSTAELAYHIQPTLAIGTR